MSERVHGFTMHERVASPPEPTNHEPGKDAIVVQTLLNLSSSVRRATHLPNNYLYLFHAAIYSIIAYILFLTIAHNYFLYNY